MPATNKDKQRRGISLQRILVYMMRLCQEMGYISFYEEGYKIGKEGYTDQKQFKAPYRIRFMDDTEWIVFTTTSLRERIKEQYWEALNLKQINPAITQAYLVYPDGLEDDDLRGFITKNAKIQNHGEFSTLDALISQDSFFNLVEAYALSSYTENAQRDRKGKNFEKRVAAVLSNPINLEKWKTNDEYLEGLHYSMFKRILFKFGLSADDVNSITSTSDEEIIGHLPSNGKVKTDVLTEVVYEDGTSSYFTISCKRSSNSSVSVHQYSADSFASVLDPNNNELKRVLNEFQRCGNKRDMDPLDAEILTREIQPHIFKLCEWAIAGIGGEGNPQTQWANYIIIYHNNDETISVETANDYCRRLAADCTRAFNTPFSWSYQGDRGNNIQLSCPIYM